MQQSGQKIPQEIALQHPLSKKQVLVSYTMAVSPRARNLTLKISPRTGLEVIIPSGTPLWRARDFMRQKESWVLKHLSKNEEREKNAQTNALKDGSVIHVLGKPKTIRFLPTRKQKSFVKEARALKFDSDKAYYDNEEILVYVPQNTFPAPTPSSKLAKQALEKHFRAAAKKIFNTRTAAIAQMMGLTYNRITVKGQKTRWGSCSRSKNLNFNWRLILADTGILDSIIVHELAHTVHLNHGKRFYALVEKYCPDFKNATKKLKNHHFMI